MEGKNATGGAAAPQLIRRTRRSAEEAHRDAEVLKFIGRFRFVTDELLAQRFGVQRQQINARIRKLEAAGLVARSADRMQPRVVMLTRNGARAVELPPRRAARTDAQRDHELALVWLVIQLERAGDVPVRTERECRELEAVGAGEFSVSVERAGRPVERRWPDLVLDGETRRSALELELSPKGRTRLRAIVDAYATTSWFDEVVFLVRSPAIARLLRSVLSDTAAPALASQLLLRPGPAVRLAPWPGLDEEQQREVRAATEA